MGAAQKGALAHNQASGVALPLLAGHSLIISPVASPSLSKGLLAQVRSNRLRSLLLLDEG